MAVPTLAETAFEEAREAKVMASDALTAIRVHTAECGERQKSILEKLDEGRRDRQAMRQDVKSENAALHKRISDVASEQRASNLRILWWIIGLLIAGASALVGTVWYLLTTYAFVQPPT